MNHTEIPLFYQNLVSEEKEDDELKVDPDINSFYCIPIQNAKCQPFTYYKPISSLIK